MKKRLNEDGTTKRYILTWKDFAKFVPENVKLLMEQYSQEHVTPFVTIGAETGDMTCGTPIWANLKHDPNVKPPTWQVVSDEQKESLHATSCLLCCNVSILSLKYSRIHTGAYCRSYNMLCFFK